MRIRQPKSLVVVRMHPKWWTRIGVAWALLGAASAVFDQCGMTLDWTITSKYETQRTLFSPFTPATCAPLERSEIDDRRTWWRIFVAHLTFWRKR